METKLTEAGPHERTVTVQLPAAALLQAEERAARRLSRDLKIKGFRPGKAPRRVVESMVGPERIRSEALEATLPELVGAALREHDLVPAVPPSVTATRDTLDGVEVDVTVTLWPTPTELPHYGDRRIVVDGIEVTDEETDERIERIRNQYAELEEVDRPASAGDYVMIDIKADREGAELEAVSSNDLLYEVGSGSLFTGIDEPLTGSSAGDIHQVDTDLPADRFGDNAGPAALRILVKGVRAKRLPDLTDEWVADVSEFDTVAELREQLAEGIAGFKRAQAGSEVRSRLLEELLEEMEVEVPDALVDAETQDTAHRFLHRLGQQGVDFGTYLQVTGQDEAAFIADLKTQAERNLRTRILLDAVIEAEGIEVDADEVNEAIDRFAEAAGEPADGYRRQLQEAGQVQALVGDMLRQKALDLLAGRATAVDGDGHVVVLEAPADDPKDDGGVVPAEVIE